MASERDKEFPQLRRVVRIYCPEHGAFKVSMLPPFSCPRCESKWRHSDMLRRSRRKECRWKYQQYDDEKSMAENGKG